MKRRILTALLAAALAAGALAGCGNRAEEDGRIQTAMADAGDSEDGNAGSLGSETLAPEGTAAPAATATLVPEGTAAVTPESEKTAAPTAMVTLAPEGIAAPTAAQAVTAATPAPEKTAAPAATPAPEKTAAPTAEPAATPAPIATAAPTAAPAETPAPIVTVAPTAEPIPAVTSQPVLADGAQANEHINSQLGNTMVASANVSAELHNSEFIALLNADREAMGLNPVSDNGVLDGDALASAEALSVNYSHDSLVRISEVTNENIGRIQGFDSSASDIYLEWKNSAGHWAAMIDPDLQYCSVAKYGEYWVFMGYASNPIVDMSTEEAVEQGLLTQIGTNEDGNEIYASGDGVEVEEDEDIIDELESLRDL